MGCMWRWDGETRRRRLLMDVFYAAMEDVEGGRGVEGRDVDGTRQEEMIGQQVNLLTNQLSHTSRGIS